MTLDSKGAALLMGLISVPIGLAGRVGAVVLIKPYQTRVLTQD
ncbi:hypothetical protein FHS85_003014 [Rhodoligotrophos appendicifer]|nr:hypothetical protein [Rhodoligotrophos appendicifer]